MQQSLKNIRNILIYAFVIALLSLAYFIYAYSVHPIPEERETFLTGIGEGFGKAGLALSAFIYFRTLLKLLLGQGSLAHAQFVTGIAIGVFAFFGHLLIDD